MSDIFLSYKREEERREAVKRARDGGHLARRW